MHSTPYTTPFVYRQYVCLPCLTIRLHAQRLGSTPRRRMRLCQLAFCIGISFSHRRSVITYTHLLTPVHLLRNIHNVVLILGACRMGEICFAYKNPTITPLAIRLWNLCSTCWTCLSQLSCPGIIYRPKNLHPFNPTKILPHPTVYISVRIPAVHVPTMIQMPKVASMHRDWVRLPDGECREEKIQFSGVLFCSCDWYVHLPFWIH